MRLRCVGNWVCWCACVFLLTSDSTLIAQAVDGQAVDGHAVIRSAKTESDSEIVITTTNRVAGAVHSLTWRGYEFIDSADHGRQLQSASNFDCDSKFFAETFNPTEAGSMSDGDGEVSTSRLLHFVHGKNWLQSTTQMAFWLQPDEQSGGHPAKNQTNLSDHLLTKRVQIGIPGFENVIRYDVTFSTPLGEQHRLAQFEVLTGYMPIAFRRFHALSLVDGNLSDLDDGPGEQQHPVIVSTADGKYAMGALAVAAPVGESWSGPTYGRFAFDAQKVTKWNVVSRLRDRHTVPAGDYSFQVLVVVGSLPEVHATLLKLSQQQVLGSQ